jgi:tellurite resistance protein
MRDKIRQIVKNSDNLVLAKDEILSILEKYRGEMYRDKEKAEREAV